MRLATTKTLAKEGDLSVTALYTSQTWAWGGLTCAHLFATTEAKRVFEATNAALAAARLFRRDLVPLPPTLLHRHAMIDYLLHESGYSQIVELAAGLSRRGAAFTERESIRYTEVDLPHVVAEKRKLLERSEEGRQVLARPGYQLVAADVETASLDAWAAPNTPLFVIAEGLTMYLAADAQRQLWAKVKALAEIAGEVRFVFDLVPVCEQPRQGAIGGALESLMKRFTGGRSFERDTRTRGDIARELATTGFERVDVIDASDVVHSWHLPHPDERTQQTLFVCTARRRG